MFMIACGGEAGRQASAGAGGRIVVAMCQSITA